MSDWGRKWPWLTSGCCDSILLKTLRKLLVRIVGVLAEIRTEYKSETCSVIMTVMTSENRRMTRNDTHKSNYLHSYLGSLWIEPRSWKFLSFIFFHGSRTHRSAFSPPGRSSSLHCMSVSLLPIWQVPGSNFDQEFGYFVWRISWCYTVLPGECRQFAPK